MSSQFLELPGAEAPGSEPGEVQAGIRQEACRVSRQAMIARPQTYHQLRVKVAEVVREPW